MTLRTKFAAVVLLLVCAPRAEADLGYWHDLWTLGQLQLLEAPGAKGVKLAASRVVLVPFYQKRISRYPAVLVRARFELVNPGDARRLTVTLPERKGLVYKKKLRDELVGHGGGEDEEDYITRSAFTKRPTIAALSVTVDGKPAKLKSELVNERRVRKRYSFDVALPASGKAAVVVAAVVYAGRKDLFSDGSCEKRFFITYVPTAKPGWAKPIGPVLLETRGGGYVARRALKGRSIRRKATVTLGNFDDPPMGDDCGSFSVNRVLHASSSRQAKPLSHFAAAALDGDPASAWIDDDKGGGVGAWIQIPTRTRSGDSTYGKQRRVKGLTVQGGPRASGAARVKRLRVACLGKRCKECSHCDGNQDCDGKPRELGVFSLPDDAKPHRLRWPKPKTCGALRLSVVELHGRRTDHVTLAEVAPIF